MATKMKKGFEVFRAISPSSNFDLVAFKSGKLYSFEVRTGYINGNNKLFFPRYKKDKALVYAIVDHSSNKTYYFPENFEELI